MVHSLHELLQQPGLIVAPGCHDALGARLVQECGFPAVYMSGNATSAARLGKPDIGLLGLAEMVSHARGIASAVDIPLICDADTGYGDVNGVIRTVREYEAAGVAGIHIEDQVAPKKCGAMPGIRVVPLEEAVARVRAAVAAKRDPQFKVIARTDARAAVDFDEAIRRGQAFAAAGADVVYVEDLQSRAEIEAVPKLIPEAPLLFDVLEAWPWSNIPQGELEAMGYRIAICCLSATFTYAQAVRRRLTSLKDAGHTRDLQAEQMDLHEYERILGLPAINSSASDRLTSDAQALLRSMTPWG